MWKIVSKETTFSGGEMERGDNQLLGQVDMIIVSFRCKELKQGNRVKGRRYRGSRYPARLRHTKGRSLLGLEQDADSLWELARWESI
jgi:hypothetical protein